MHIHIAAIMKAYEPITQGISAAQNVDKVYLLIPNSEHDLYPDSIKEVENFCRSGCKQLEKITVDPFNYTDIILTIKKIYTTNIDSNPKFSINITGGSKVQAAAECVAAHFISASMIYIINNEDLTSEERTVHIPAPSTVNPDDLCDTERDLLKIILKESRPGFDVTNKFIAETYFKKGEDDRKQNSHYYLRKLEDKGLITYRDRATKSIKKRNKIVTESDKRLKPIELTDTGELYAHWID